MLAREVISLPMHPYLTEEVQDYSIEAVRDCFGRLGAGGTSID